jgi:16S rRNA processing protein RimM
MVSKSGSPQQGEPVYIPIAKLRRPHGVHGELQLEVLTDFPQVIKPGINILIGKNKKEYGLATVRPAANILLVGIKGVVDRDQASLLRNQLVYLRESEIAALPVGRFYHKEILGMQVEDGTGNPIGSVAEILVTGANDVYVVKSAEGNEILIPAIKSVVLSIDREKRLIIVKLQDWA